MSDKSPPVFEDPNLKNLQYRQGGLQGPSTNESDPNSESARIVQFSDETKTLPDGSRIIYAENNEKIVLYQKKPFEKGLTFVYERKTGRIFVNGQEGTDDDKKNMVKIGSYMLENSDESDMVTISVQKK